jgi:hypothetical protein
MDDMINPYMSLASYILHADFLSQSALNTNRNKQNSTEYKSIDKPFHFHLPEVKDPINISLSNWKLQTRRNGKAKHTRKNDIKAYRSINLLIYNNGEISSDKM